MHKATKDLEEHSSVVILLADKGNVTVVMHFTVLMLKVKQMLGDEAYAKLKKDLTAKVEARVNKELRSLENREYRSKEGRRYL